MESPLALDSEDNLYVGIENSGTNEVVQFDSAGDLIVAPGSGFGALDGGIILRGLASNVVTEAGGSDLYLTATTGTGISYVVAYGPPPDKWDPPLRPPAVTAQYALSVDSDGALLGADINPRFWADTSYYVEWGTGKCSEGGCPNQTPLAPGALLGAGIVNAAIATKGTLITGLAPNTTYRYRFVAASTGGGPVYGTDPDGEGPEGPTFEKGGEVAFTTPALPQLQPIDTCANAEFRTGPSAQLADCRAYEMVSPVDKNGTDIATLININSNPAALNQSALAGSALTYTTSQAFGDAKGAPYVSQHLARRGAGGWGSEAISPSQGLSPVEVSGRADVEYRAFTPDLCTGALVHFTDPPLTPESVEGFVNVNTRDNCSVPGTYGAVTTTMPPNKLPKEFVPEVQGLSADGRCTVFQASDQLIPSAAPSASLQIYQSCGEALRLLSMLPNGIASSSDSSVGTTPFPVSGFRSTNLLGAVSNNGSRVYWTASASGPEKLFLRVNGDQEQSAMSGTTCVEEDKACTLKVSETVSSGPASFWAASEDGSRALFTLEGTPSISSKGFGKLYEYDLAAQDSTEIAKEVTGVIGASEDATRAYFTSRANLAGPNAEGSSPTVGKANLYLFDATKFGADRFRFIGTLSAADADVVTLEKAFSPVNLQPYKKTSRVAASGEAVAFMSNASLTGYDNVDSKSGKADAEVFLYRANANEGQGALVCVSCNPTGQRPVGRDIPVEGQNFGDNWSAALLPTYITDTYGSRVISADGNRVYFNGYESLVNGDTNGRADVYQWEAPGTGTCSTSSSSYSPPNGGCLSLISSGESPTDSAFLDASADGTDVFFTTDASLLPQDPGLIDIYDARSGGGYPLPPPPSAECEGEACQSPPAPPNDPTPASLSFNGPGNLKPAKKKAAKKKQKKQNKNNKKNKGKKNKKKAKKQANNNRKAKR